MNMTVEKSSFITKLLLFFMLGGLIWSVTIAIEQVRLMSWPAAAGTIVEFEDGINSSSGGQSWYANPKIRFLYNVDGVNFESDTLNPSPFNYQNLQQFKSDSRGFDEGALVKCWYNPSNPSAAYVVNRGITLDILIVLVISGFYTLNAARVFVFRRLYNGRKRAVTN